MSVLKKIGWLWFLSISLGLSAKAEKIEVQIVADEARAVLAVLEKLKVGREIAEDDWQKIFQSEGYVRLKSRELSLKRPFNDEDFKKFVLSPDLLNRFDALKKTLADWEKIEVAKSGRRALKYLPKSAKIRARIYPVIKPRDNSFVFEIKENPAIFLFLDPQVTGKQFENTLTHELHHIGFGTVCPTNEAEIMRLTKEQQTVLKWISAFGEGLAMLAAAGNWKIHPHLYGKSADRIRWDRDIANFNQNLRAVEIFFTDVLAGRLTDDQINEKGFSFFGIQGAWYTVGWKMSIVIEKIFGRRTLIKVFCDQRNLLPTFNQALKIYQHKSKENLAFWAQDILANLER